VLSYTESTIQARITIITIDITVQRIIRIIIRILIIITAIIIIIIHLSRITIIQAIISLLFRQSQQMCQRLQLGQMEIHQAAQWAEHVQVRAEQGREEILRAVDNKKGR
jgi:uncharacterized paraquat-inducible protein A